MAEDRVEGATLAANGRFVAIAWEEGAVAVLRDKGAYERFVETDPMIRGHRGAI